jgi:hypothetical protein
MAKEPLLDWLDYNGHTVVTKPTKEFLDESGRRRVKGNMDIELLRVGMPLSQDILQRDFVKCGIVHMYSEHAVLWWRVDAAKFHAIETLATTKILSLRPSENGSERRIFVVAILVARLERVERSDALGLRTLRFVEAACPQSPRQSIDG